MISARIARVTDWQAIAALELQPVME